VQTAVFMLGGGQTLRPWHISRSVIPSAGPAGAEFARRLRTALPLAGRWPVGVQISLLGAAVAAKSPCSRAAQSAAAAAEDGQLRWRVVPHRFQCTTSSTGRRLGCAQRP
jgi:hypothetical protein